jgi:hypothetical protein
MGIVSAMFLGLSIIQMQTGKNLRGAAKTAEATFSSEQTQISAFIWGLVMVKSYVGY